MRVSIRMETNHCLRADGHPPPEADAAPRCQRLALAIETIVRPTCAAVLTAGFPEAAIYVVKVALQPVPSGRDASLAMSGRRAQSVAKIILTVRN